MPGQTSGNANHSTEIVKNLQAIQHRIIELSQHYHRNPGDITLLAVSKTKPASDIKSAYEAGQIHFGENYLQEALEKIKTLNSLAIDWHFIGAIQSNKTRELAEHFSWVHSVDRFKIARRLSEQRPNTLPPLNICLQVNLNNEASKAGLLLDEIGEVAEQVTRLPNIKLRGLMAIPEKTESLDNQRQNFALLRNAMEQLQQRITGLDTLSMGMSNDMEAAIAEGSTILRIGTAIFGARE